MERLQNIPLLETLTRGITETVTHDPKINTKSFREAFRKSRKLRNTIFRNTLRYPVLTAYCVTQRHVFNSPFLKQNLDYAPELECLLAGYTFKSSIYPAVPFT